MEDERTLQATFTGSVGQQVGLHLLQAGQQGAAGTAGAKPGGDSSDLFWPPCPSVTVRKPNSPDVHNPAPMLRPALPANRNLDGDGLPFLSGLTVLSTIHCSAGFTLNTSEVYLSYINQTLRHARHVPSGGGGGGGGLRRREELRDQGRCRGGRVGVGGGGRAGSQRTLPFQLLHGYGAECCTKVHYCIPPFSAMRVRRVLRQRRRDRFTGGSSAAQR